MVGSVSQLASSNPVIPSPQCQLDVVRLHFLCTLLILKLFLVLTLFLRSCEISEWPDPLKHLLVLLSCIWYLRFLSLLENEIYSPSSPIWREDFNQTPESLAIPSPGGSSKTPTPSPAGSAGRMMGEWGAVDLVAMVFDSQLRWKKRDACLEEYCVVYTCVHVVWSMFIHVYM